MGLKASLVELPPSKSGGEFSQTHRGGKAFLPGCLQEHLLLLIPDACRDEEAPLTNSGCQRSAVLRTVSLTADTGDRKPLHQNDGSSCAPGTRQTLDAGRMFTCYW